MEAAPIATIGAVTCVERLVPTSDIFPPTSCSLEPVALSVAEIEVSVFLHCCSRFLSSFSVSIISRCHEAHGNPGSFSNVNPSTDNWINGFFGIGGFYLCCVANFDSARSEVVFARAERSENKAAFDALYQHKSEIESKLGTELQWNRGDDIKSSKVFIQLDNVSIENEDDWPQMAKFHAEWSKKFYDLIVPYITVDWQ